MVEDTELSAAALAAAGWSGEEPPPDRSSPIPRPSFGRRRAGDMGAPPAAWQQPDARRTVPLAERSLGERIALRLDAVHRLLAQVDLDIAEQVRQARLAREEARRLAREARNPGTMRKSTSARVAQDVSELGARILASIAENGPASGAELAARLGSQPHACGVSAAHLGRMGKLVRRDDRTPPVWHLPEAGGG
jgi:hypothetical protein